MHLNSELPDDLGLLVEAQAQEERILPDRSGQPFETGYGMLAKYGDAPSAEEIDENRTEMFRNFAQEF